MFRLKSATQDLGGDFAQLKTLQPVLLGSSCSGACSEAAAFTETWWLFDSLTRGASVTHHDGPGFYCSGPVLQYTLW